VACRHHTIIGAEQDYTEYENCKVEAEKTTRHVLASIVCHYAIQESVKKVRGSGIG